MKAHQEREIVGIIETLPQTSVKMTTDTELGTAFSFRLDAPAAADPPQIPRGGAGRRSSIVVNEDEQVLEMRLRFPGMETDFPQRGPKARAGREEMESEHEQRMAETLGYEVVTGKPAKHPAYIEFEVGVAVPHFVLDRLGVDDKPPLLEVVGRVEDALEAHAQAAYGVGYGAAR